MIPTIGKKTDCNKISHVLFPWTSIESIKIILLGNEFHSFAHLKFCQQRIFKILTLLCSHFLFFYVWELGIVDKQWLSQPPR